MSLTCLYCCARATPVHSKTKVRAAPITILLSMTNSYFKSTSIVARPLALWKTNTSFSLGNSFR